VAACLCLSVREGVCVYARSYTHAHTRTEDISQEMNLGGTERLKRLCLPRFETLDRRSNLKMRENKNEKGAKVRLATSVVRRLVRLGCRTEEVKLSPCLSQAHPNSKLPLVNK
jgi:hypothetical protein